MQVFFKKPPGNSFTRLPSCLALCVFILNRVKVDGATVWQVAVMVIIKIKPPGNEISQCKCPERDGKMTACVCVCVCVRVCVCVCV